VHEHKFLIVHQSTSSLVLSQCSWLHNTAHSLVKGMQWCLALVYNIYYKNDLVNWVWSFCCVALRPSWRHKECILYWSLCCLSVCWLSVDYLMHVVIQVHAQWAWDSNTMTILWDHGVFTTFQLSCILKLQDSHQLMLHIIVQYVQFIMMAQLCYDMILQIFMHGSVLYRSTSLLVHT